MEHWVSFAAAREREVTYVMERSVERSHLVKPNGKRVLGARVRLYFCCILRPKDICVFRGFVNELKIELSRYFGGL